jgi:hypothetical protein
VARVFRILLAFDKHAPPYERSPVLLAAFCFSRTPSHTIVTVRKQKRNIEGFKITLLSNRSIRNPKGRNAKGRKGMKTIGRVFYSGIAH